MSQQLEPGDKVLAAGDFEQGKTTGLAHLAEMHPRVIAFDPEGELDPRSPLPTMRPERWAQVRRLEDLARVEAPCVSLAVGYTELEDVAEIALENLAPGLAVVLLEFSNAVPGTSPTSIPRPVNTLWRTAHKQNTTVLAEIHRSNEIPKICRRADHVLAWRIPSDDAEDLAEIAGTPELELADRLPEHHYLHAHAGHLTWRKPFPLDPPAGRSLR
jgi:hypothetical protein